jgi:hypothetical protein
VSRSIMAASAAAASSGDTLCCHISYIKHVHTVSIMMTRSRKVCVCVGGGVMSTVMCR